MNMQQFPLRKKINDIIEGGKSLFHLSNPIEVNGLTENEINEIIAISDIHEPHLNYIDATRCKGQYGNIKWNLILFN